jgi:2-keto-4-pentenoate hydratase/2-oxohepta-3-ene-1,7-dioic acid hydratase in catechol pathway
MRLATFATRAEAGRLHVGAITGDRMLELPYGSMRELLRDGDKGLARVRNLLATAKPTQLTDLREVLWKPPVPDAEKFLCVGKNYRTHLAELQRTGLIKELPNEPTGFVKLNACLAGHEEDVVRPASVKQLDYEPELVFVIGRAAYQVKAEHAFDYVAGITILNDLTCRETQKREVVSGSRFWTSKNAPGFGPLGPCIVTMDEVPDPYDLWVTCSVNGEQRMRVNTSEQIWKLPAIIEHFSRLIPLQPGDMFSTGAPGGVAVGKANAEALFLKPGDVVECAIESPALVLRNRIVAPPNQQVSI